MTIQTVIVPIDIDDMMVDVCHCFDTAGVPLLGPNGPGLSRIDGPPAHYEWPTAPPNDLSDGISATRQLGHDRYFNNYCKAAAFNEINQHQWPLVGRKLKSWRDTVETGNLLEEWWSHHGVGVKETRQWRLGAARCPRSGKLLFVENFTS